MRETASEVSKVGPEPFIVQIDVADITSIKSACQKVHSTTKRLDGLVNNAGILRDALLGMINDAGIDELMRTNIYSVIHLMQYAARVMVRQKSGSIVNVASLIGRTGNEGEVVYGASKAAVIGATKSAARELAPHNVRVNAVTPGIIDTHLISHVSPEKMAVLRQDIKMGRLGTPAEVATVIVFLLSDRASYVTGQAIGIDGGMWL